MNVSIETIYVTDIKIDLTGHFNFSGGIEKYYIDYGKSLNEDGLIFIVTGGYKLLSQTDKNSLQIQVSMMFKLLSVKSIDKDDLYLCVMSVREKMQEIAKTLFSDTLNPLVIDFSGNYEEIMEGLDEVVLSLG